MHPKEDVTVIIGVKNRCGFRLENALKSIRNQDYDQDIINIILVDYDSAPELIDKLRISCKKYNTQYLRVNNRTVWSRSRCLNIAIKRTKTKYLLLSDVDIIFEKNYISEAVKKLQEDPYQVLYYPMRDTGERDICEGTDVLKEYSRLCKKTIFRRDTGRPYFPYGVSICFVVTRFVHQIRGLDEKYGWGKQDHDLIKRLNLIGLKLTSLESKTSHIHQYHPKYEGLKKEDMEKIERDKKYFLETNTILRNNRGWGEA